MHPQGGVAITFSWTGNSPPVAPAHALGPGADPDEGITLRDIPDEAVFAQDASWYPNHTNGGGLVVADPATGWSQTYRIPIPVHVEGSYQAELYVAWEVLLAQGVHQHGPVP